MGAPTSRGDFRVRIFCLSNNGDVEDFQDIHQSVLDGDGRYEIMEEDGYWTKEGDRMVVLKYLELDGGDGAEERY